MSKYTPAEKARIRAMIRTFEQCLSNQSAAKITYVCERLDWLHRNRKIGRVARADCASLIERAIEGQITLASWQMANGHEPHWTWSHNAKAVRRTWIKQIIKDLRSYL